MEPCIHHGKTPPCAPLIAEKGITKVIIGMPDPNPKVNGKGIKYLHSKGILVQTGILEDEITRMNEVFVKFIKTGIPFCILKTAMTMDGKIATVTNASKWISGEQSRRYVHELRQQVSGLMVGVDTIIYDDPLLNTRRGKKKSKDPLKIITDTRCRIPLKSKVLTCNPQLTILATTDLADRSKLKELERLGVQTIICPVKEDKVDLAFLIRSLGIMGIDSILIEGGSMLAYSALTEQVVDKVTAFISPKILGGKFAPTPVGGDGIDKMHNAINVMNWKVRKSGEDFLIEGYINNYELRITNYE
jgi:diaminohydroxyphosphoribosylaminopyrimidine deaminase/5-amino-6-(5-phosphoribosylamino)uracil reductase